MYIQKLIQEYCPNGVEYKTLGEVCKIEKGEQLNKEVLLKEGQFPVINGGINPSGFWNDYNYEKNLITISQGGASAGYVNYVTTNFWAGAHCYVLTTPKEYINYKLLYYIVKNYEKELQSSQVGAGIPSVSSNKLASLKIPIPPIEVQREIVRILDKLTELIDSLKIELTLRNKQCEYYRDELLNLTYCPYYSLEDLCEIVDYRGKTPQKTIEGIFLVTAKNIRKGYIDYDKSKEYISPQDYNEVMRRGMPKIGDVLITTEAPCGNVAQIDNENIALAQRVIKYRPKTSMLNSTYLKYILLSNEFQEKLKLSATGGTVQGIKGSKLHKLKIPVPPLKEQERIVAILDKFDALRNDIHAEIELRKKQYEYYRDKLLQFENKRNEYK